MTDLRTPCQDSPDDWYIDSTGRQYVDDVLAKPEDLAEVGINIAALSEEQMAAGLTELERQVKVANLRTRRQALEACWNDCFTKVRTACLHQGLKPENLRHGIWGGYTPEQRQEIVAEIRRRRMSEE